MTERSRDYSYRLLYRAVLILLLVAAFAPEIVIRATVAFARLKGCVPHRNPTGERHHWLGVAIKRRFRHRSAAQFPVVALLRCHRGVVDSLLCRSDSGMGEPTESAWHRNCGDGDFCRPAVFRANAGDRKPFWGKLPTERRRRRRMYRFRRLRG
jgi:hypothetical protein